jgi:hypothetical protein
MRNTCGHSDPFNGDLGWVLGIVFVTIVLIGLMAMPR